MKETGQQPCYHGDGVLETAGGRWRAGCKIASSRRRSECVRGFRFGEFGFIRRLNEKNRRKRLGAKFLARARKDGPAQLAMNSRSALIPDQQSDGDISFPDR